MSSNKHIPIFAVLTLIATIGTLFYLGSAPVQTPSIPEPNACIARSTIISRGQGWVDRHIGYDIGEVDGYRTDCSGFVSMSWDLGTSKTTQTLRQVATNISKGELQPGDAIICEGAHVVLFGGWHNSSHFVCMQQANHTTGTIKGPVPYPYWNNKDCFHPIKYNKVC